MNKDVSESFESHFGQLKDPRIDRKKLYPLIEIMFVVLCGSICGAESWRDFVLFGKSKVDYLRQYYAFENGIPSKNTFARVFAALDTEMFKRHFVEWVKSLQTILNNEDQSRVRKDNAGENMALIRHITVNLLNQTKKLFKNQIARVASFP